MKPTCTDCGGSVTHDDTSECDGCGTPLLVCEECVTAGCPLCLDGQTHVRVYEGQIPTYDAGAQSETLEPWWRDDRQPPRLAQPKKKLTALRFFIRLLLRWRVL